jgi:hypothetical protein
VKSIRRVSATVPYQASSTISQPSSAKILAFMTTGLALPYSSAQRDHAGGSTGSVGEADQAEAANKGVGAAMMSSRLHREGDR